MTKSKAKTINSDNTAKTTKLAVTAMLAALSAVLMFLSEHSVWGRLQVR